MNERLKKLRNLIDERACAGAFLTGEENIRYFIGFKGEGYLVATPGRCVYITDSRYTIDAQKALRGTETELIIYETDPLGTAAEQMKDAGGDEWLCEGATAYSLIGKMQDKLPGARFTALDRELDEIRAVKEPEEVACIVRAQRIAERALTEVMNDMKKGVTERFVRARLEYYMQQFGSDHTAFETIIAAGANGASPHARTTDRELRDGDFVVMDFGASVEGYCSDMTRTLAIGGVDTDREKMYNTVLEAQLLGIAAVRPGAIGRDVDAAARERIARDGVGEAFSHSLGHGVGLFIHELPVLSKRAEAPLRPGNVVTVEPGVYFEGRYGIRIEDMCLVTEDGHTNLTAAPKNLIIL